VWASIGANSAWMVLAAIAFNLTRVLARSRRSSRPKLQMMSDSLNDDTEPAGAPLQGADTS
jgi:hypothetical protein